MHKSQSLPHDTHVCVLRGAKSYLKRLLARPAITAESGGGAKELLIEIESMANEICHECDVNLLPGNM